MAASLLTRGLYILGENCRISALACTNVRLKSKKAGTSTRNKRKNTPGKARGWKKEDGDNVEKGMILFRQLGLKVYPGENVGLGKDLTLYALEPGRIMVTVEKLCPYPNSPLYRATQEGKEFYRKFYHVLPEEQEKRFKLISQI